MTRRREQPFGKLASSLQSAESSFPEGHVARQAKTLGCPNESRLRGLLQQPLTHHSSLFLSAFVRVRPRPI